jgi:hypothetical protein
MPRPLSEREAKRLLTIILQRDANNCARRTLSSRSPQYRYLLYAFDGLRTLSPAAKHKFVSMLGSPECGKSGSSVQEMDSGELSTHRPH